MTLTTLRQDAKRAAEELAFRFRCGIADGHGWDAHGNERLRSHEQPAGSHVSGRDAIALNTALALANVGEGEQGKPDKEEGLSSERDEDAPVNATQGLGAKKAREEADEAEGQGRGQDEGDDAEDDQRGDLELECSEELEGEEDDEEDEEEEEEVEDTLATNNAGWAASAVVGAGKSIHGLQAVLSPRHGSAIPSTEYAGKRKHSKLVKMDPAKLAAEILRLDEQMKNQKRKLDEVVSAKPGTEHAVVITQSYDELVATVEKALRHVQNTEWVMRREAKLVAKDRAKNRDMREVLKCAAVRLEDCAASMKGVVVDVRVDSMENAQKKLTDEVARKIDSASSNIAGTAERAITTSGVTNSLNIIIAMLSGRDAPRLVTDGPQGKESHKVAEKEARKRVAEKETVKRETGKKAADKDTGKRVADKDTGKGESSRGGKRQKGPVATSVTDLLKIGGAVFVRAAGTARVDAAAGSPLAPSSVEAAKGKDKAKNQGRSGCKPPPAALKVEHEDDDDSDENDVVELVWQRFMGPSDTSGTSGKRKGCGIRPPPKGGEGMVGEPWLGGRRRWLGHHSLQEVQYLTAIAVMCYDKKVDHGLKLIAQQRSEWAEDISAAGTMCTGLFATMHLRNLCGNVDRYGRVFSYLCTRVHRIAVTFATNHVPCFPPACKYHHMFKAYHDFTRPGSTLGNAVAWAAAVGKEAADEEPDVTGDQVGLFAGAVACAIAMVWETCNGLDLEGVMDAGYVAAQCVGTPEEKTRGHVSIVTAVFKWAKKESARKQAPEVTPKQIAEKIETAVVNRLGARLGDPTLVGMVVHEAVDVLMTWCDYKIAAKAMETNGLYLALPYKRLSAKKRSA
ncbi:unnamed protein product [Closterium sp. NIES-65]|nr:unnamed protein product [Closterium sp. NIES-65]